MARFKLFLAIFVVAIILIVGGTLIVSKTGLLKKNDTNTASPQPVQAQKRVSEEKFDGKIAADKTTDNSFVLIRGNENLTFFFTKDSAVVRSLETLKGKADVQVTVIGKYNVPMKAWYATRIVVKNSSQ